MKKLILLLAFALTLLGTSLASASESITINNVSKNEVMQFVVTNFMKGGGTIADSGEYLLVIDDNRPKPMPFILNWGTSKIRHVFNFVQIGNDVMITLQPQIIAYPGSAREYTHNASLAGAQNYFTNNKNDLIELTVSSRAILRDIKAYYNGDYRYGFDYKKTKKRYEITSTTPGSPAEKAGLRVGDQIVAIDGVKTKDMRYDQYQSVLESGGEGHTITMAVKRGELELPITMTKQFYPAVVTNKP